MEEQQFYDEFCEFIVFGEKEYSATKWMQWIDTSFKLCTENKEQQLLENILTPFCVLAERYREIISKINRSIEYVREHPIYPHKDINQLIVTHLCILRDLEYQKAKLEFSMKALSAQRINAFISRFYLPSRAHQKRILYLPNYGTLPIEQRLDLMALSIFDTILPDPRPATH